MTKALMMGVLGLILGTVGLDPVLGAPRFAFGQVELLDGIGIIPVAMGLFGLAEILLNAEKEFQQVTMEKITSLIPTRKEIRDSVWPIIRGTVLGTLLGLIPGMNVVASSFLSYSIEKKVSKHPELFGSGLIEGVAAPETANNAHSNGALIPLFTLGIPPTPSVAVLMGAFILHGLTPGPLLFKEHPILVWGIIASFCVGNIMLLILNLPLIRVWVKILKIPYGLLFSIILLFMVMGTYCINNSTFDVILMSLFGVIGYILRKQDFPLAPAILTFILGPLMERSLRQSLEMSRGDFGIFLESPIAVFLLLGATIFLIGPAFKIFWRGGKDLRRKAREYLS
jgi:putative tricarboxylic transport membrane protein